MNIIHGAMFIWRVKNMRECVCVGSKTEVPISLQWKKHPQHLTQPCPWPACPSLQTLADFFLCPELVTYRCLLLLLGF